MDALGQRPAAPLPSRAFVVSLCATAAALVAGAAAVPYLALSEDPLWLAPLVPMGVLGLIAFLWNTQYGLCFAAFAIAPLGIVQKEIGGITINLPEALILLLVAKETVLFIAHRERIADGFPRRALACFLLASLLGLATGYLRGNNRGAMLQGFRQYNEYIVLYLLAVHRVRTKRQMTQILVSFLLGMTLVGMHGILQRFTGMGIPLNQVMSDMIFHGAIRSGSFYGSTPLGAMMVLAIGVAVGLALGYKSIFLKAGMGGIAVVCLTAAVFTNTRASWIAIAVTMLFVFVSIRKTPFVILVTVLAVLVFTATLGPLVVQRMAKLEISKKEESLLERVRYYRVAWYIFSAHPITGLGWGCEFSVRNIDSNNRYVPPPPRDPTLRRSVYYESTVHSAYLQILARIGLVGLVPLLWFLASWFAGVLRTRRAANRFDRDYYLFIGVAGGLLGYLFHATLENFFQWPVMAQSLWLLLGITSVMAAQISRNGRLDRQEAAAQDCPS